MRKPYDYTKMAEAIRAIEWRAETRIVKPRNPNGGRTLEFQHVLFVARVPYVKWRGERSEFGYPVHKLSLCIPSPYFIDHMGLDTGPFGLAWYAEYDWRSTFGIGANASRRPIGWLDGIDVLDRLDLPADAERILADVLRQQESLRRAGFAVSEWWRYPVCDAGTVTVSVYALSR